MVNVRFYGSLKKFGHAFSLDCGTTAEVLRALFAQIKGLREFIQKGYFKVRIGRQYVDHRYLEQGLYYKLKDGDTVHFTPVIGGAKKQGIFSTIVGAAMIVVGAVTSWAGGGMLIAAGIGVMAGGVAQMLTKTPKIDGSINEQEKKSSSSFGGLQNRAAQGNPVPLAYGQIRVGSMIISQGVETVDTAL